jgi:AcrR family transcriptional regulator
VPRALTAQEKCLQCDKLLDKGKAIVLSQGIKKISIDEITKAAGMAKGSFYQHFESKEHFLYELVWNTHKQIFNQAENMFVKMADLQTNIRDFLMTLFTMPELVFFIKNERDINDLFNLMPNQEIQSAKQMEVDMFGSLLIKAGLDVNTVKPGVVHNYIHTLFLMKGCDLMAEDDLPETFDRIMDSLIAYIFGGVR